MHSWHIIFDKLPKPFAWLDESTWSTNDVGFGRRPEPIKSKLIDKSFWVIQDVRIQIRSPAEESNRIFADETLCCYRKEPCPVVIEPRSIIFTSCVLEGIDRGAGDCSLAEGFVVVFGLDRPSLTCQCQD